MAPAGVMSIPRAPQGDSLTARHSQKPGRLKGWWVEGKALGFVSRACSSPCHCSETVDRLPAALSRGLSPKNILGDRRMGLNEANRSMRRAFPALHQVFSSCFTVPELAAPVSVVFPPSRAAAVDRKAMSMPPPPHPTDSPPPPATHSSSRPILCDFRPANPPSVSCEQEVTCPLHSWFFPLRCKVTMAPCSSICPTPLLYHILHDRFAVTSSFLFSVPPAEIKATSLRARLCPAPAPGGAEGDGGP